VVTSGRTATRASVADKLPLRETGVIPNPLAPPLEGQQAHSVTYANGRHFQK
jgi:hypothetical protein